MPVLTLARNRDEFVLAGVCTSIAERLGVDPTLVRLLFAVLTLAAGAGIALYVAFALYLHKRPWLAIVPLLIAASLLLDGLGLTRSTILALVLIAVGLTLIWQRGGSLRPGAPLSLAGLVAVAAGAALLLTNGGSSRALLGPGAVIGGLLLVLAPWLWQLAVERDAERAARIRTEERAEVAARVHDSVLQTLALIQRHTGEPRRIAALARRQERELRGWLYGDGTMNAETLAGALAEAATDIEELHGVRVELASAGDAPLTDDERPVVLAAREAMANAAKFSGAAEISVYTEVDEDHLSIFVRDRGTGFDRVNVPPDRQGLSESIEGRMARAGGTATIASTPGAGTEVELVLPRRRA
jgi:signal transduction histidine kinase